MAEILIIHYPFRFPFSYRGEANKKSKGRKEEVFKGGGLGKKGTEWIMDNEENRHFYSSGARNYR